jgi:hypothetical protein
VLRTLHNIAVRAAVGELVQELKIAPWIMGEVTEAFSRCFAGWWTDWKEHNTPVASATDDVAHVLASLRGEMARFPRPGEQATVRQAGFRMPVEGGCLYYVSRKVFREEIGKGRDAGAIAKMLKEKGRLRHDKGRLTKKGPGLNGKKDDNFYAVYVPDLRECGKSGKNRAAGA